MIEFCISNIVTEFQTRNSTNLYYHVTVHNDQQISSALPLFILCWSRNMTTGARVVGWNCSTDIICTHNTITRYTQTSTFPHVSATNCQYKADIKIKEQLLPAFYGTLSFITAFTSARHLSLS